MLKKFRFVAATILLLACIEGSFSQSTDTPLENSTGMFNPAGISAIVRNSNPAGISNPAVITNPPKIPNPTVITNPPKIPNPTVMSNFSSMNPCVNKSITNIVWTVSSYGNLSGVVNTSGIVGYYTNQTHYILDCSNMSQPNYPFNMLNQTGMPKTSSPGMPNQFSSTTLSTTTPSIDMLIQYYFKNFNANPVFLRVFKLVTDGFNPYDQLFIAKQLVSGNVQNFVMTIDKMKPNWRSDCGTTNQYENFLEGSFLQKQPLLTSDTIKQLLPCRQDCNFGPLFDSNFTANVPDYIKEIIPLLPPPVAATCSQMLSKFLANIPPPSNPAEVLKELNGTDGKPINIGALFRPSQFLNFSGNQVEQMIGQLQNIPASFANIFGPKLPKNTSIGNAAKVLSAAPVEIIINANPGDLASNLSNTDLSNMNPQKKSLLAKTILGSPTPENLKLMMSTGDPGIINSIPLNKVDFNQINVKSIDPNKLPNAVLQKFGRQALANSSLSGVLNDPTTLARSVASLRPSDFKNLDNSSKINSVVSIVVASMNSTQLTSIQRQSLYNTLISGASSKSGSSLPNNFLSSLNQTHFDSVAELFVEAPPSHLAALATIDTVSFGYVLSSLSAISASKCVSFSYQARSNFTSYAVQYLLNINNRSSIVPTDLATLGSCFAPTISSSQLDSLSSSDFLLSAGYFQGIQFQPSADMITKISNKIKNLTSGLSNADSVVKSLGEAIIYYGDIKTDNIVKASLTTYGSSISANLKSSKNTQNSTVQASRLGLGDSSSIVASCKAFQSSYIQSQIPSLASSRRKRSTCNSAITCSILQNVSPDALTASQLSQICSDVFLSCLQTLGSSSNFYTTDQISALAALAISTLGSLSSVSDANIQNLNQILLGFTPAQLSQLTGISSATTVQILGANSDWTADQLTSLVSIIKTNLGISNVVGSLGNLACGLNSTDLPSAQFSANLPTLKLVTNAPCPFLGNLYQLYLSTNGISTLDSGSVSDMGGLAGGATISDLTNMNPEVFLSFSTDAISNLPAATVNQLPISILSLISTSQLSSFLNSPYYSGFNSTITSALNALTSGQAIQTNVPTSPVNQQNDSNVIQMNIKWLLMSLVSVLALVFSK